MARLWICKGYTGWWICLNKPEFYLIMPLYVLICLNIAGYAWICQKIPVKQSSGYARMLNLSDALQWMLERFLRKPKRILLQDPQKQHLRAFHGHLQGLASPSQTVIIIRRNIVAFLFDIHSIKSSSSHGQVCLMRLYFERYFSHDQYILNVNPQTLTFKYWHLCYIGRNFFCKFFFVS